MLLHSSRPGRCRPVTVLLVVSTLLAGLPAGLGSCTTVWQSRQDLGLPAGSLVITIDDGPPETPGVDSAILEVLARHRVKACFSLLGYKLAGRGDFLRQLLDDGHLIVFHGWRHEFFVGLDRDRLAREMADFEQAVRRETGRPFQIRHVRPPNGLLDTTLAQALTAQGLVLVGASHFPTDPFVHTAASRQYLQDLGTAFQQTGGGVLVLHDGTELIPRPSPQDLRDPASPANRSWVPQALDRLIADFKTQGYVFPDPATVFQ